MRKYLAGNTKKAPDVYVDYILCKKFGWTPEQLDQADSKTIDSFIEIMNIEQELADDEVRRAKNSKVKQY